MGERSRAKKKKQTQQLPATSSAPVAAPGSSFGFGDDDRQISAIDGSETPILDAVGARSSSVAGDAPAAQDAATSEEDPLAASVRAAVKKWGARITEADVGMAAMVGASDLAFQALNRGDAASLDTARQNASAVLGNCFTLDAQLARDIEDLEATGADVSVLRQIQQALPGILSRLLTPGLVGYKWVPAFYEGNKRWGLDGYREGLDVPQGAASVVELHDSWYGYIGEWCGLWAPILAEAPAVRAWAAGLPADPEPQDMFAAMAGNPLTFFSGRARQYLGAVALDAAPSAFASLIQGDHVRTSDQILAEDATEFGEEIDFDALDAAVDTAIEEIESGKYQDDDDVMAALDVGKTPAEKEYILRRISHIDVAHGSALSPVYVKAYSKMVNQLGGSESEEFQAYRADALDFAGQAGEHVDMYTAGEAYLDMIQAVPGAMVGQVLGGLASTPILGDILDEAYGEDAKALIAHINMSCGVDDPRMAAMSAEMAYGAGKVTGGIGFAAGGSGAGGSLATLKHASNLSRVQKAGHVAKVAVGGADLADNTLKGVFGVKATGDDVTGWEQAAALFGMAGGGLDGVSSYGKSARRLAPATAATPPVPAVPPPVSPPVAPPPTRLAQAKGLAKKHGGTVSDVGGASMKAGNGMAADGAGRADVDAMSTEQLASELQDWLDDVWNGHPLRPQAEAALKRKDVKAMRSVLHQIKSDNALGTGAEGVGALAGLARP